MDRRAFLAMLITSPAFATSFEEFKQNESAAFKQYQDELQEEFKAYLKIIEEEFSAYKNALSKFWQKPELSGRHTWVQYSANLNTRSMVNFEEGFIKVESVGGAGLNRDEEIKKHLNRILKQDTASAVNNDQLIVNIEDRLSDLKHVLKEDVPTGDVILDLDYSQGNLSFNDNAFLKISHQRAAFEMPIMTHASNRSSEANAESNHKESQANGHASESITIRLPSKFLQTRAKKQSPIVSDKSSKYQVNFSAVMSLMHTESSFNPMALSESAYGLLMINPDTSGRAAHKKIYGNEKIISPAYLYNNVNNIELGSAYFNLLFHKHLQGITHPVSRLYCAIVSYNAGLGNVARAFSGRPRLKKAISKINEKSPEAVYKTLQDQLPFEESKIYLTKVNERLSYYIQEKAPSLRATEDIEHGF